MLFTYRGSWMALGDLQVTHQFQYEVMIIQDLDQLGTSIVDTSEFHYQVAKISWNLIKDLMKSPMKNPIQISMNNHQSH